MKYSTPKYPRVITSGPRHRKLALEAAKLEITLEEHAENIFKARDLATKTSNK